MRIAVVFLSVLVLTGCVGSDPPVTPAPTPTSTPLFASDEEALKAAEVAYKRFNAVAERVLNEGGTDPERLEAVATGELLAAAVKGAESYESKGYHSIGRIVSSEFRIQQTSNSKRDSVTIYVCEDVTKVDVVDSEGTSVVSPSRPARQTIEMAFDGTDQGELIASSQSVWSASC
jgi:hypothetical protein